MSSPATRPRAAGGEPRAIPGRGPQRRRGPGGKEHFWFLPERLRGANCHPTQIRVGAWELTTDSFNVWTIRNVNANPVACSFTLPMVLALAVGRDADRDRVLAKVFDGSLDGAEARLRDFLEGLGVSTRFASYGVSAGEEAELIRFAQAGSRGRNFIHSTVMKV